ncbi:MAG: RSP_2648 family PIN domain-containing protein [Paracoccaceae bacterium]
MKLFLDTCVIYPDALRDILLGAAARGAFEPLWSARVLEEWARAARKKGAEDEARLIAQAMLVQFPRALVAGWEAAATLLILPDPDDVHVLAAAITGHADAIVTFNAADFPRHVLAAEGLQRRDPDGLLWELWSHDPGPVAEAVSQAMARAPGEPQSMRAFLKRAGLPRLGKAMQG